MSLLWVDVRWGRGEGTGHSYLGYLWGGERIQAAGGWACSLNSVYF